MLLRYFVKNYRSISDKIEFNMLGGKYTKHDEHVHLHNNLKILKNSAFYGPNASGKSNFIISIEMLYYFITEGTTDKDELLHYRPFLLNSEFKNIPTEFEIDFLHNDRVYSYSIKFNEKYILEEWLYILDGNENEMVFERTTEKETLKSNLKFNESFFTGVEEKVALKLYQKELRHNQPFITEGYNKDLKDIKEAYDWFKSLLYVIYPDRGIKGLVHSLKYNSNFSEKFNNILKDTGLGIDKVIVDEEPFDKFFGKGQDSTKKKIEAKLRKDSGYEFGAEKGKFYSAYLNEDGVPTVGELKLLHKDNHNDFVEFSFRDESMGTIRILSLIPALIYISENDAVVIIDELETSIHPLLIKYLLKIISKSNSHSKGQLIFSTHQTNLLDLELFRQDEIWFFNKDENNSTKIYPLSDFKVRFDLDIRKGYLKGMFGSIPCLKNN